MINANSLKALKKAQWTPHFIKPLYDSYSFALIPQTVSKLLSGKGDTHLPVDTVGGSWKKYDTVVLFFIDGFGWEFFDAYEHKYPFLDRFSKEGVASKISSQFPSTTAAHVTTINSGLEVGQTGIYEWFYYEPIVDEMISPLIFSYAGDHVVSTLLKPGFTPQKVFPFKTLYQQLAEQGIKSVVMQNEFIAHSPYSNTMLAGARNLPYRNFDEALQRTREICEGPNDAPTYVFIYFGDIDSMGHRHGITSTQFADAVDGCWNRIESQFYQKLSTRKKTAVLVTADHGMCPVDPKGTIYLNRFVPEIKESLMTTGSGKLRAPAGSCRDFFLHIKEGRVEEVQALLSEKLMGVADVVRVEELLKAGFFGKLPPSQRLLDRIGNLLILPYAGESVWWYEKHRFEQHFYAAHGGLTPSEMESILLFAEL